MKDEIVKSLLCQEGGDHYKKFGAYQPWAVLAKWLSPQELKGFCKGTVIAYLAREEDKGGRLDIKKSLHTLQLYLELSEGNEPEEAFDFIQHLQHQREWSEETFGPGHRPDGLIDHIRKELDEIEQEPDDLEEWIDVVILALDGAWRSGNNPKEIVAALVAKQTKNEGRKWPDWRTAEPGKAIEHVKEEELLPHWDIVIDGTRRNFKTNQELKEYADTVNGLNEEIRSAINTAVIKCEEHCTLFLNSQLERGSGSLYTWHTEGK